MKTRARNSNLQVLSPDKLEKLRIYWNEKLRDPAAFVPTAKLRQLDITEVRKGNQLFGKFACSYLKNVISRLTSTSDVLRRQSTERKIVAVGYGMGYDSKWLAKVSKAGLQTWWIEVSTTASIWAVTDLDNQLKKIPKESAHLTLEPCVREFEIQSLLADPGEADLDLASVEIWYLSRLLNCLPTKSAKIVLQEIGRTMFGSTSNRSKRNAVVVVNALSDHNDVHKYCGGTSIIRSKKMILANLSYGAGCTVEPRFVKYYDYFGKHITAMTIMAK